MAKPAADKPYEPVPYHRTADETAQCPNCNLYSSASANYCGMCGHPLKASEPYAAEVDDDVICPVCDKHNDDDSRFCTACGIKLAGRTDVKIAGMTASAVPMDALTAGAIAIIHTPTTDGPWDGPANVANLSNDDGEKVYKTMFAWQDPDGDPDKKNAYSFPHHLVSSSGNVGAASTIACSASMAALNGAHGVDIKAAPWYKDRPGIASHVLGHLKDSGVKDADLPKLMALIVAEQMSLAHGKTTGEHSHAHPSYGVQGADASHTHPHHHDGDSNHGHHVVMTSAGTDPTRLPFGMLSFASAGSDEAWSDMHFDLTIEHVARTPRADPPSASTAFTIQDLDPLARLVASGMSMTAASMVHLGARLGIEGSDESGWKVLHAEPDAAGVLTAAAWDHNYETYQAALAEVAIQMAQQTGDRPVLAQTWRSDMAYENVSTGDGRRIAPGGILYRDTPMPLMLQTVTAPGHDGAVLAGSIQQCGTIGGVAIGTGDFDDSAAGSQALSIIQARGKFGVSIDVAEAEGEFECTETDEDGMCTDGEMVFSMVKVMGNTLTPFPAFENAYIEVAQNASNANVAASGAPEDEPTEMCVDCQEPSEVVEAATAIVRSTWNTTPVLTAAGGPARPARSWFDDPQFTPGDGRLVRQPDGQYLCPLTITASGQVFGHFAGWRTCHTGYERVCVTAPRSRTNYRAYNLRPLECDDGEFVHVGTVAMGCGHIADDGSLSVKVVKDFYDGGPGAICAAFVHAGEDRFGGWFAGTLAEDLTPAQIRKFSRLSVSGHWKEVWQGKGLDLVACAAGVFSPGFPVSSMAAAGFVPMEIEDGYQLPDTRVAFKDGRPVALVAAGVVRQPMPWERAMADLAQQVDDLRHRLTAQEGVTGPLLGLSAERLIASMEPTGNGNTAAH